MNIHYWFLIVGIFFYPIQSLCQERDAVSYVLDSGDRILIRVFAEDDLSMDVLVPGTGIIKYPFLGELAVSGLTTSELAKLITEGLKGRYLLSPEITVSIQEYRPFYLHGEVNNPGGFQYRPGLSVQQAVALAGGFTERASRDEITVVRSDKQTKEPYSSPIQQNDSVRPGDLIRVQRRFF